MEYRSRTPFGTTKRNLVRMLRRVVHITPSPDGIIFGRDVDVPVRDGTILRIDVARPETPGNYAVLICGQPYGKGDYPAASRSGFRTPFQYSSEQVSPTRACTPAAHSRASAELVRSRNGFTPTAARSGRATTPRTHCRRSPVSSITFSAETTPGYSKNYPSGSK